MIEWATLSPYVPVLIVVLALVVAALSVAAVLVARRATEPASGGVGSADGLGAAEGLEVVYLGNCSGSTADEIRAAMKKARREMRQSRLGDAPQFMMIGETGAGKSTLLADSGLPHPFGGSDSGSALDVWLFGESVVFDPKGELMLRRDGRSNDEAGWLCLLRELKESRPRRPLDGLVLTIPSTRLFTGDGAEKDEAALQADASLRANALYERLAELQQVLGMQLPIDVVITQSDHISGWGAFTRQLDLETQKQIFGWSSPYAVQAPYQAKWVSEAFDTINDRLEEAQAGMFCIGSKAEHAPPVVADAAELLDFPQQVAKLEPATRIYLNYLFSQSAFVDSFRLRGLYFTGAAFDAPVLHSDVVGLCPPPPKSPSPDRRRSVPDRILFAHDLLRAKVFPENSLGDFTEQAMRSATLEKRLAQAAALLVPLIVLGGMLYQHGRVAKDSATLAKPVAQIAADLRHDPQAESVQKAGDLVAAAKPVEHYILRALFLPPSWLSPQHGQVRRTFQSGYDEVVFPALHSQLDRWQKELGTPWPAPAPGPHIAYPVETPEFLQLQAFSEQLTRFDDDVWLYDCLVAHCVGGSGALSAFDRLSRDLLDVPLVLPSSAARRFEAGVLEKVTAQHFGVTAAGRAAIEAQVQRLFDRLDRRLFSHNPLLLDLLALNQEIESLELDPNATAAQYRQLRTNIEALQAELARPEVAWMGLDTLQPGPVMTATFDALAASPYVGKKQVEALEAQADDDFQAMRTEMATISNPSTGNVLAQNDDGSAKLELSQGVQDLDQSLAVLLGEKFMVEESTQALRIPSTYERLFWSQNGLKKVTDLVTSYQGFASDGVDPAFPQNLESTTSEVALSTLSENMLDSLAASQSFRPAPSRISSQTLERGLAMQVRNFTTNNAALAQILDDFQALQLYDAYDQLTDALTAQQTHMLEDLQALLDLEPLFQPVDESFSWWQGVQPPAPPAFGLETPTTCPPPAGGWCPAPSSTSSSSASGSGASSSGSSSTGSSTSAAASANPCAANPTSEAELKSWTSSESATASHLAEAYAEPILGSPTALHLLPTKRLNELTDTWQNFVTDVDQATNKQPGNAIQTLTQFINETMMQLSLANCFELLPPSVPSESDYFRERQSELMNGLAGRCRQLVSQYAAPDYRRWSKIFNERLAGRVPFAVPDPATPITAEATPAALRDFYASFDQSACLIDDVSAGDAGFSGKLDEVRTFTAQMEEVRDFLAPFLDQPKKYPTPTYGYRVEFRVNRNREQGADQIIDWQLQVGDETQIMGLRTAPPPPPPPSSPTTTGGAAPSTAAQTALGGEWIYGEKTVLSLRWARESPATPTTPPTSDRARLSGRTVIWDYENLWSLLALVRDYPTSSTDLPGTQDPKPQTLRLKVGTSTAAGSEADAVVYVRLTFLSPDFATEIDVPGFPIAAPRLTEPAFSVSLDEFDATFTNQTVGLWDSLLWRFGDGAESSQTHPTHTYADATSYDVTLQVTTDGVSEQTSQTVHIAGDPPAASFTTTDNGLEVHFKDTSTENPTAWSWQFGDGQTSSEQNPTHLYGRAQAYEVTLEVTNQAGHDVAKKSVEVHDLPPGDRPEARFIALPEGGNFVRFVDESSGEIESRTWYFGDGKTSTDKDPGHLYESGGDYEVRLVVRGPGGEVETVGRVTVR